MAGRISNFLSSCAFAKFHLNILKWSKKVWQTAWKGPLKTTTSWSSCHGIVPTYWFSSDKSSMAEMVGCHFQVWFIKWLWLHLGLSVSSLTPCETSFPLRGQLYIWDPHGKHCGLWSAKIHLNDLGHGLPRGWVFRWNCCPGRQLELEVLSQDTIQVSEKQKPWGDKYLLF